jgi:hypothetical protein
MREGAKVYVWFRWEYQHPQPWNHSSNNIVSSLVMREVYDCTRQVSKELSQVGYAENNLQHELNDAQLVFEEGTQKWVPVIPGTIGEYMLNWACTTAPAHAKAPAAH